MQADAMLSAYSDQPGGHALRKEDDARFAGAMVATIQQPLLVLDEALRVLRANPAFYHLFQVRADQVIGRHLFDPGSGQWEIPELRALLDTVLQQGRHVENYRVEHDFPAIGRRIIFLNARRIECDVTRPPLIVLAIWDATELEQARYELEGHREYLEKLVDAVRDPLVILDWELRVKHANQRFYETFQVDPNATEGQLIYELGNRQWDIPALRQLLEDILPNESSFDDFEVEHEFETIGRRIMCVNARRLDHLNLILLAIEDVTERRQWYWRQQMLSRELSHRVKNVLTLVDALAARTVAGAQTLDEFREVFHGRLRALARAHGQWLADDSTNADLHELVVETAENCGVDLQRLQINGEPIRLTSAQTMPLNLTVHELCTNAIKYGALSQSDGRVDVSWSVASGKGSRQLRFEWKESGGPMVQAPEKTGFGIEMIENLSPYELGGASNVEFKPDGLRCQLNFPLA